MNREQLGVLGSMLTFAAENIPGGLNLDEQRAVEIFWRWASNDPFYAIEVSKVEVAIENDGDIYITENDRRVMHARIKSWTELLLQMGPGDVIELNKEYGPLVFVPLRVSMDLEKVEWVVERYCPADNTWEAVDRIPGQLATDFKE